MKELEKTKRISISATLFLLIILIGFLTYKRPKHVFKNNSESVLKEIVKKDYILSARQLESMSPDEYALIDVRSNFEYEKSHIKDAVNIPYSQILEDKNMDFINSLKGDNKTAVFYGEHPDIASNAWLLLYQLGYNNIKVLSVKPRFEDNKFYVDNVEIEKPAVNYAEEMKKATSTSGITEKPKPVKKVITVKKKKKRVAEGGC
jgi:rhodanese-related sulfurtransferase